MYFPETYFLVTLSTCRSALIASTQFPAWLHLRPVTFPTVPHQVSGTSTSGSRPLTSRTWSSSPEADPGNRVKWNSVRSQQLSYQPFVSAARMVAELIKRTVARAMNLRRTANSTSFYSVCKYASRFRICSSFMTWLKPSILARPYLMMSVMRSSLAGNPLRDRYWCLKTPFRLGPFLPRDE